MGNVTDIVAPNLFHPLGIKNAMAACCTAKLWETADFPEKIKDIPWENFLDEQNWTHQSGAREPRGPSNADAHGF